MTRLCAAIRTGVLVLALALAWLGALASTVPADAAAQAYVTFDDWALPCTAADGCTGGYLEGPAAAFSLRGGDGFVCADGRCLEALWPSPGTALVARAAPWMPPGTAVVVQAQFFFPPSLFRRLIDDSTATIPLLQVDTNTDDYYMRLTLVGDSSPHLHGAVWLGGAAPVHSFDIPEMVEAGRWMTIRWSVALPARLADRHATATVGRVETRLPITAPIPSSVALVGARALGTAFYTAGDAPLGLAIDNLCVARGSVSANTLCPLGLAIPPVDDGGVPGLDAGADSSVPFDGSLPVDSGLAVDSGDLVDSGGGAPDAEARVASFRGAGGCTCDVGRGPAPGVPWAWFALAVPFVAWRRR